MEPFIFIIVFMAFTVLGLAAQAWGEDSRVYTVDPRYPEHVALG